MVFESFWRNIGNGARNDMILIHHMKAIVREIHKGFIYIEINELNPYK